MPTVIPRSRDRHDVLHNQAHGRLWTGRLSPGYVGQGQSVRAQELFLITSSFGLAIDAQIHGGRLNRKRSLRGVKLGCSRGTFTTRMAYRLTKRYPTPTSVNRCWGMDGLASTFLRRLAMCTRT